MNIKSLVKNALIAVQNRKYDKALAARRMSYARWQQKQADGQKAVSFVTDDYVVIRTDGGTLAEGYEQLLQSYLAERADVLLAYGDEDVEVTPGEYDSPYFKPDWSPDLLEQWFYLGNVVVMHRSLLQEAVESGEDVYDEKQMEVLSEECYERLVRRAVCLAGGYAKRQKETIGHVPGVLFHRNTPWAEPWTIQGTDNVTAGMQEQVPGVQPAEHLVSVVIPSKDHPQLLETCLGAIQRLERELPYEIIVVDNGSNEENRQECHKIFGRLEAEGVRISYLYEPMEFDFSRMCNLGAERATGDLLLFLNDDVELACENTLAAMARKALRPYTGAVGLKLYYPQGKRIQHCGITNLPMGPVHKLQFLEDDRDYYFGNNRLNRNVLAVTAACLMIKKTRFREAGGFPEELKVAFNDVALCFRLHELGYYNLVWNEQFAYHHESLSRGDDESDHKLRRLLEERRKLYQRHPQLENEDPYYSRHLGRDGLDTRIRPAYETGGNVPQKVQNTTICSELDGYRQDACLMLRVEMSAHEQLLGYGVVLGDNNACYDKGLLLCKTDTLSQEQTEDLPQLVRKGTVPCYYVAVEGQYRPDLVENMPDQTNVGLCGFWLEDAGALPAGTYRIGMLVRNRVTGTKLIQFSNREWKTER